MSTNVVIPCFIYLSIHGRYTSSCKFFGLKKTLNESLPFVQGDDLHRVRFNKSHPTPQVYTQYGSFQGHSFRLYTNTTLSNKHSFYYRSINFNVVIITFVETNNNQSLAYLRICLNFSDTIQPIKP